MIKFKQFDIEAIEFIFNLPNKLLPGFDRIKHRIMGRYIVNRWLEFNGDYLNRLKIGR